MNGWQIFDIICTITGLVFAFLWGYEYRRGRELKKRLKEMCDHNDKLWDSWKKTKRRLVERDARSRKKERWEVGHEGSRQVSGNR